MVQAGALQDVAHHVHPRRRHPVDHGAGLAGIEQHLHHLVPHRPKTRQHDRAGAADRHGQALDHRQVGAHPHHHQDGAGLHQGLRPLGGGEDAAQPLADHGHAVALAQVQVAEPLAGQRAVGAHAELGHADPRAEQVPALGRRADAPARPRGQRRAQHMVGREHLGGADLDHRRAVQRVVGQGEQRPGEAMLAHQQRAGGVGVVVAVGHHRARFLHPLQHLGFLAHVAVHHGVATVAQAAGEVHVFFEDHEGAVGALELRQQRLDRRAVAVEQHLALHGRQHVLQADLELVLEERQHQERKDQEHQELPDERRDDHVRRHHRMVPAVVGAVTGVGHGFRRPLQALQERARLPLQVVHAQHVERAQQQHGHRQQGQQGQEASRGAFGRMFHGPLFVSSTRQRCFGSGWHAQRPLGAAPTPPICRFSNQTSHLPAPVGHHQLSNQESADKPADDRS